MRCQGRKNQLWCWHMFHTPSGPVVGVVVVAMHRDLVGVAPPVRREDAIAEKLP